MGFVYGENYNAFSSRKRYGYTWQFCNGCSDQFALENGERVMNSEQKGNTYVWIRRFENQDEKVKLYKAVYESKEWLESIAPTVAKLVDRNSILVQNLSSTPLSVMK